MTASRPGHVVLTTTAPTREEAERLALMLVERRLAACVQLAPIDSVYRWNDTVERAGEVLLTIKTRAALVEEAAKAIRAVHPYETPEIIGVPVIFGSPDYLSWIDEVTSPAVDVQLESKGFS